MTSSVEARVHVLWARDRGCGRPGRSTREARGRRSPRTPAPGHFLGCEVELVRPTNSMAFDAARDLREDATCGPTKPICMRGLASLIASATSDVRLERRRTRVDDRELVVVGDAQNVVEPEVSRGCVDEVAFQGPSPPAERATWEPEGASLASSLVTRPRAAVEPLERGRVSRIASSSSSAPRPRAVDPTRPARPYHMRHEETTRARPSCDGATQAALVAISSR